VLTRIGQYLWYGLRGGTMEVVALVLSNSPA
jgi:hypothetical protein